VPGIIKHAHNNNNVYLNCQINLITNITNTEQLLDEVEHDSDNYQGQSLSYLPKPKAEADNTN